MSYVLGVTRLADFTVLQPVLSWHAVWNLWTVYFWIFQFFSPKKQRKMKKLQGNDCPLIEDKLSRNPKTTVKVHKHVSKPTLPPPKNKNDTRLAPATVHVFSHSGTSCKIRQMENSVKWRWNAVTGIRRFKQRAKEWLRSVTLTAKPINSHGLGHFSQPVLLSNNQQTYFILTTVGYRYVYIYFWAKYTYRGVCGLITSIHEKSTPFLSFTEYNQRPRGSSASRHEKGQWHSTQGCDRKECLY